jgi:hypothetical protein
MIYKFKNNILPFRTVAKPTQTKYGISNEPATFESLKKLTIVQMIAANNKIIIIKPIKGDCKPKKPIDQILLMHNCKRNTDRAAFVSSFFLQFFHIIKNAIPIIKYRNIHTGANIHEGGLKNGLFKVKYHVLTESLVNTDPITPADWQINRLINNFKMFGNLVCITFNYTR